MKKKRSLITVQTVRHIADLAKIPINSQEEKELADGFSKTLDVVDQLNEISVDGIEPTHQVTGLSNIFREDVVDEKRMLPQDIALSNAKKTHNGFFVVKQILEE